MFDFLTTTAFFPFTVALLIAVAVLLIETTMFLISGLHLDSLLPDWDFLHVDADAHHGHVDLHGFGESWLHLGKVPFIVVITTLVGGFGATGLFIQGVSTSVLGSPWNVWLIMPVAIVGGVLTSRLMGGLIGRILPKDETTVVSAQQFLGQVATIYQGVATTDLAAEARLIDAHGQVHYIRVVPEQAGEQFTEGTPVLLIARHDNLFTAVRSDAGSHASPATPT